LTEAGGTMTAVGTGVHTYLAVYLLVSPYLQVIIRLHEPINEAQNIFTANSKINSFL